MLLLTYAWKVPATFTFPVTSGWGFNPNWLVSRPWLCCSMRNDSVFCIACLSVVPHLYLQALRTIVHVCVW